MSYINADKCLFVLTPDLYLNKKMKKKSGGFYYDYDVRKSIIDASVKADSRFEVWGEELGSINPNRIKTLLKIAKENKDSEVYCLIGAEKLHSVSSFLKPKKDGMVSKNAITMMNTIKHIVIDRDGIDSRAYIEADFNLNLYLEAFTFLKIDGSVSFISSSLVRNKLTSNEDIHEYVESEMLDIMKETKPVNVEVNNDLYSQIEDLYVNGGRYGARNANKLVYKDNVEIFNSWRDGNDKYGFGSRDKFLNDTQIYKNEFNVNDIKKDFNTATGVIDIDCIELGEHLVRAGYKPAILNLASRYNPCGGYDDGMSTQEEALCRCSNLSQSLYQYLTTK